MNFFTVYCSNAADWLTIFIQEIQVLQRLQEFLCLSETTHMYLCTELDSF